MTQEEKALLLKDLSARLSYRIIGVYYWKGKPPYNRELTGNLYDELNYSWSSTEDSKFIPYLRPMSSITEEEWEDYQKIRMIDWVSGDINGTFINAGLIIDWLNEHHFDYRGLIEKGLAIAVTKENNPYERAN